MLAETVRVWPGALALDAPDAALSYAELSVEASALADRLTALGIGPGDRVGVRLQSGTAELYVAILGVLCAGAAYVPVDADDPPARAAEIWRRSEACAVVGDGLTIEARGPGRGSGREVGPDDDAWVIFTSGSTGEPKGVAVTHRSAAALLAAERALWTIHPDDRVLAGLSVAFDASCEEMWSAWANGAALVPAPRRLVRSGADLGAWLVNQGVTVVSTVPTLAAMWPDDALAGMRLLILGGESCPDELGWHLAAGRETWNTYGPTEATVVSTAAPVAPGRPVTIGWPLNGWSVAVVDRAGAPVPFGEPGELVIGGEGLGRYIDPVLDAERYAPLETLGWTRAYRSGDLVCETPDGLRFVGRRDGQVKLDGRRIELGEVEARLCAVPGVTAAACAVRSTPAGRPLLVAYFTGDADVDHVRGRVLDELPAGIAPLLVALDALPLRTSAKLDRDALPWPPPPGATVAAGQAAAPVSGTATWLADRWADQLGSLPIAPDSDFFALGGSSVAVARLVSVLRGRFPSVAVADVYDHPRLAALADRLDALGEGRPSAQPDRGVPARRWSLAQLAGVLVLIAAGTPSFLLAILAYDAWQGIGVRIAWPWLVLGWLALISAPGRALIVIAARRLLLARLAPGRYRRRGWLACRVWFVDRLAETLHVGRLGGTPWAPRAARWLGADVGGGVRLGALPSPAALIHVGAGATIEGGVDTHGWWVEGDALVIDAVRIGAGARIGARTILMPGARIGAGAEVEPGSVVTTPIPAGERWSGSPARRVGIAGEHWPPADPPPHRRQALWTAMFAAGLVGLDLIAFLGAIPALLAFEALGLSPDTPSALAGGLVLGAPLFAATFVVAEALLQALSFRAVSRLVRPDWHADFGATGWALWFCEHLMEATHATLFPLYATVYTRGWLRLHGLRIGRRTEVSTAEGLNRFVTLGELSFVADAPLFNAGRARRGWLHVAPIEVGSGTFVGNGALLNGGTVVGDHSLIGIETTAPARSPDGTSWFGAPAIEFPRTPASGDASRTTDPPARLVAARGATEVVRILLPTTVAVVLSALVFLALQTIGDRFGAAAMIGAAPLVAGTAGIAAVLVTIAVKWLLIGRYRAVDRPLWSSFVWRDEIVNSCQEQLAGEWLLGNALGTPLMTPYLRAMGARVGRDVWCETLAITEFDVVTIGDGCAINRGACLETHLFHDRVLSIGPTNLGDGSTVGPVSAVLPDTTVGAGCVIGARSVVLRGEELPPATRWHGAPVVAW